MKSTPQSISYFLNNHSRSETRVTNGRCKPGLFYSRARPAPLDDSTNSLQSFNRKIVTDSLTSRFVLCASIDFTPSETV